MITVLITGCGGHFMYDTLQCYKGDVPIRLIGVASELDDDLRPLLYEYIQVPTCDDPMYIYTLLSICNVFGVDVLIPTLDAELMMLYKNRDVFRALGVKLSISANENLGVITNKLSFMEFCELNDIPHPNGKAFTGKSEFEEAAAKLGYPFKPICVKALDKAGSRGFRIIDNRFDYLDNFLNQKPESRHIDYTTFKNIIAGKDLPKMIVQEYLPGKEYSVDLLADNGNVLYMIGRVNEVVLNSIPIDSISQYNEDAYCICIDIVKKLKLDGNINIDFMFDKMGKILPIEINARISATISLAAASGVNLAYLQVLRLMGYDLPDVKSTYGKRLTRKYRACISEVK
jgi:carbamoyl-phosphate synthase large subunit